jgi:hypothetical protein
LNEIGDHLLTFDSTHQAMLSETLLESAGVTIMIIPTPRQITASCGLAIVHAAADQERVDTALAGQPVTISGRYRIVADAKGARHYTAID